MLGKSMQGILLNKSTWGFKKGLTPTSRGSLQTNLWKKLHRRLTTSLRAEAYVRLKDERW